MTRKILALRSAVALYFVVCFEILIIHSLSVLAVKNLPVETAWGKVPPPAF
jgi:hypothetical protein